MRGGALCGVVLLVLVAGHQAMSWCTGSGTVIGNISVRAGELSSADEIRRLEDNAMLARALVYVDTHPVKAEAVDPQKTDEHKQWLADVERELARHRVPAVRSGAAVAP
jgi:hypothetical protein